MQPSRRHCIYASLALLALLLPARRARADNLTITSTPSGATVEIDGLRAGTTPFKIDYPGGYFHKTHSVFGSRLQHAMTLLISMDGYVSQKATITDGPFEWVAINGRRHGNYFLLKSAHFNFKLDPVSFGGSDSWKAYGREGPIRPVSAEGFHAEERPAQSDSGTVAITSDPSGAEIYVDGQFIGQTPSTVRIASGAHHVEVKSSGRKPWSRDLNVLKDSQLTLRATLDVAP